MVIAFVLSGCGKDATGTSHKGIFGTYTLQSWNGDPLPILISYDIFDPADKFVWTSGELVLNRNATFHRTFYYQRTKGGQVTTEELSDSGTFTHADSTVALSRNGTAKPVNGIINGRMLTFTADGVVSVYQR